MRDESFEKESGHVCVKRYDAATWPNRRRDTTSAESEPQYEYIFQLFVFQLRIFRRVVRLHRVRVRCELAILVACSVPRRRW